MSSSSRWSPVDGSGEFETETETKSKASSRLTQQRAKPVNKSNIQPATPSTHQTKTSHPMNGAAKATLQRSNSNQNPSYSTNPSGHPDPINRTKSPNHPTQTRSNEGENSYSNSILAESYLALPNPAALVSTLPNSPSPPPLASSAVTASAQSSASSSGTSSSTSSSSSSSSFVSSNSSTSPPSRFVPIDDEPDDLSSNASSPPPPPLSELMASTNTKSKAKEKRKKESTSARIANFFRRGSKKKKKSVDHTSTKPTTATATVTSSASADEATTTSTSTIPSSNSLLKLLRSSSESSSKDESNLPKPRRKRSVTQRQSHDPASEGTQADEAEAASSSTGAKRSIYTQKLIHLSNSFLNMFASNSSTGLLSFTSQSHTFTNSPCWILGRVYKLLGPSTKMRRDLTTAAQDALALRRQRFLHDFSSLIWSTYRRGFPNIASSAYTSDAGWGCMIRSAQMMLAQVFVRHWMGRDWRRPEKVSKTTSHVPATNHESDTLHPSTSSPSGTSSIDETDEPDCSIDALPMLPIEYIRIISLFLDSPSPSSPYSIHNLLQNGQTSSDKKVGEWFGPHAACWMIKKCIEAECAKQRQRIQNNQGYNDAIFQDGFGNDEPQHQQVSTGSSSATTSPSPHHPSVPSAFLVPKIYVSDDGTLYLDKITSLARIEPHGEPSQTSSDDTLHDQSEEGDDHSSRVRASSMSYAAASEPSSVPRPPNFSPSFHPLMILIPLRLGIERLNTSYIPSLLSLFQFPQCVGIIGGKPRASFYFVGVQDDSLLYLDPHTVQKAADLTGAHSLRGNLAMKHEIADSYHCSNVLSIKVHDIDPCMAIGFYIENQVALDEFWEQAKQLTDITHLQHQAAAARMAESSSPSSPSSMPVLHPVFHLADVSPNYAGFGDSDQGEDEEEDEDGEAESDGSQLDDSDNDGSAVDDADEGDFESARVSAPRSPEESPVPVDSASSITTNGDEANLTDSVVSVDGSLVGDESATAGVAASVSKLTDLTFAFSAAAATRLSSSAKTLTAYATQAAIQAQDGISHLATQAAQFHQASMAAAQRKMSRDTTSALSPDEQMASPVSSSSTQPTNSTATSTPLTTDPVLVSPVRHRAPSSTSTPPSSHPLTASSVCSTSTKPMSSRKSTGSSVKGGRRPTRRTSKGGVGFEDDSDDFVFI